MYSKKRELAAAALEFKFMEPARGRGLIGALPHYGYHCGKGRRGTFVDKTDRTDDESRFVKI